jgi:hypothetical protein
MLPNPMTYIKENIAVGWKKADVIFYIAPDRSWMKNF